MEDLMESAQVFEASATLQSASGALSKLASGTNINVSETESLKWAGKFLGNVDWSANRHSGADVSGNLAVQATAFRPMFYSSLMSVEYKFRDAGLLKEKQIMNFLRQLYRYLNAGGVVNKTEQIPNVQLNLGAALLEDLANNLLVELTNNGIPERSELLNV